MMVTANEKVMTNRDYFTKYCFVQDLCRIVRMWEKHLDKTIGRDAPMHEKELEYDKWIHAEFNIVDWDSSKTREDAEHWW